MSQPTQQFFQSYLLHCWQEGNSLLPGSVWRFSLEDPQTRQQQEFPTLRALILGLHTALIESDYRLTKNRRNNRDSIRPGLRLREQAGETND